jgi:hypothetical protein
MAHHIIRGSNAPLIFANSFLDVLWFTINVKYSFQLLFFMRKVIESTEKIDDFLNTNFKKTADDYADDEMFFEFFKAYFKSKLFHESRATEIFLTEEEKQLQYTSDNMIEPSVEYNLLIAKATDAFMRKHYAEQGANHCVILSSLQKFEKKWLRNQAKSFYRTAWINSDNELDDKLFRFMSRKTTDIAEGLEDLMFYLMNDVTREDMNKMFEQYASENNGLYLPGGYN